MREGAELTRIACVRKAAAAATGETHVLKSSRALLAIAAASVIAAFAAPAVALDKDKVGYSPSYYDDEIVVIAPGVVRSDSGERTTTGAHIETLTTQRVVDSSDLNLRYDADIAELHRRIRATAREACRDIDRSTGNIPLTSTSECVSDAVRDAMVQADVLVDYRRG